MGYLAVCGPDAAGKSTLVASLSEVLQIAPFVEMPLCLPEFRSWIAGRSESTLEAAQMAFLRHALNRQELAESCGGVVERTIWDNFHVHTSGRFQLKEMPEDAYERVRYLYLSMAVRAPIPSVIVYLHAPVANLLRSMAARAAPYDDLMTRSIVSHFHRCYEDWILTVKMCPILPVAALSAEPATLAREVADRLVERNLWG